MNDFLIVYPHFYPAFNKEIKMCKDMIFLFEWFSTNCFCGINTGELLPDVRAQAKGHITR